MTTTYMLWCTTYRLWLASKLAQPMLDSKTGCCLGNADARQQNSFLRSNCCCATAKPDAVWETPMLDSRASSEWKNPPLLRRMISSCLLAIFYKLFAKRVFFHPARQSYR